MADEPHTQEPPRFLLLREPQELAVEIDIGPISWPTEGVVRAGEDSNRTYANFTSATWGDVDHVLPIERALILEAISMAGGERSFWDCLDDHDDDFFEVGHGAEPCVLSAILALNAARCPTFMSCNGHGEHCAEVDFWTRPHLAHLLADAAHAARVGLGNCTDGAMKVYSDRALGLVDFAQEVRSRSSSFRQARGTSCRNKRAVRPAPTQMDLFDRPGVHKTGT
ncbi:MAG: hypothetical protein KC619_32180 [Myxococcales bacterium]|nr:hypothetical protein [Myxococcales bacterium]